jgi:hypothetical protein
MNSQNEKLSSFKQKCTSRIVIYDVERFETASQALPAFEGECTGVYMPSVGIGGGRDDSMDTPDRVWFANENGCGYLDCLEYFSNSGFLATNMYTMDDKKTRQN